MLHFYTKLLNMCPENCNPGPWPERATGGRLNRGFPEGVSIVMTHATSSSNPFHRWGGESPARSGGSRLYLEGALPMCASCSAVSDVLWGFSRQEYWSGLPCPPPGDPPNPGFEPRSPTLQVDSTPSEPPGKPLL